MFIERKVLHVDGKTTVTAKGLIDADNVFKGEYKYGGMDWGIEIPVKPEYIEKRLDEIAIGDIVLNKNGEERKVGFINPCLNKRWYSISLCGGDKLEQVMGFSHQLVPVKV